MKYCYKIPEDRICTAKKVLEQNCTVNCENILRRGAPCTFLESKDASYVLLDMGEASVTGYPVFQVSHFQGNPVLRIAYSDRLDIMTDGTARRRFGDYERGSCKYLGIELPVLPANPSRYETYTICRTGEYIFPLQQGQFRFAYIEVTGGEVELENFHIFYTSKLDEPVNSFACSDPKLSKLWQITANTLNIATLCVNQWDVVDGKLLLRSLSGTSDGGILKEIRELSEFRFKVCFSLAKNPDMPSGIGLLFGASDVENGYVYMLDLDGSWRLYQRRNGCNHIWKRGQCKPLIDCKIYEEVLNLNGRNLTVTLDGKVITHLEIEPVSGAVGFCQSPEKWAVVHTFSLETENRLLSENPFTDGLECFSIAREESFISDGAKRDRLPWSGDIDWSFRNGFYIDSYATAMRNTLEILSRHQTPEGYVWATCYPEDHRQPSSREYGWYESDMFSAWYLMALLTYVEFSGDMEFLNQKYDSLKKGLYYLLNYVDAEGIFCQRYETSKGIWDHQLGDFGRNAYTNIIVCLCFSRAIKFSRLLGHEEEASIFRETEEKMRKGIFSIFWRENGFAKSDKCDKFCDMANSIALAYEFVTQKQADKIIAYFESKNFRQIAHGKTLVLTMRGMYRYGRGDLAYRILTSSLEVEAAKNVFCESAGLRLERVKGSPILRQNARFFRQWMLAGCITGETFLTRIPVSEKFFPDVFWEFNHLRLDFEKSS